MNNRCKLIPLLFLIALLFYGCSSQTNKYDIISLDISPKSIAIKPSETAQFNCIATYGDGGTRDFSPKWSVSENSPGTISQTGNFTASSDISSITKAQIVASYADIIVTAEVSVDPFLASPTAPQNLTSSRVTPNELELNWSQASADGYVVSYGKDSNAENVGTQDSQTSKVIISNLESNMIYYFKVKAYKNISGNRVYGNYSHILSS